MEGAKVTLIIFGYEGVIKDHGRHLKVTSGEKAHCCKTGHAVEPSQSFRASETPFHPSEAHPSPFHPFEAHLALAAQGEGRYAVMFVP